MTAHDEITVGTEHLRSEEWKANGRVSGAMLKQDLVWLRLDSGNEWKKVVVDVQITSTDSMSKAFKEKEDKYREWTIRETREKKVAKAVMVPLIISHEGAVHRTTVMRWKDFAPDIQVDWVRMAQSVLRCDVVIVSKFFNKGSWVSESWRKEHLEEAGDETSGTPDRMPITEDQSELLNLVPVPTSAVCGLRTRHIHVGLG